MATKTKSISINFGTWAMIFTAIFVTLKLTHVIDWTWIWVVSPLWIVAIWTAFWLSIAGACLLIARKLETPEQKAVRLLEAEMKRGR